MQNLKLFGNSKTKLKLQNAEKDTFNLLVQINNLPMSKNTRSKSNLPFKIKQKSNSPNKSLYRLINNKIKTSESTKKPTIPDLEIYDFLESQTNPVQNLLSKSFSKPNLKTTQKLPSMQNLINIKKPFVIKKTRGHSKNNISCIMGNRSEFDFISPQNSNAKNNEINDPLITKIESALKTADLLISNEKIEKSYEEILEENAVIREQLKSLNFLLNDLVNERKYESYTGEMEQEEKRNKIKTLKAAIETNNKRLALYKQEYQNLLLRLQKLNDASYPEQIEEKIRNYEIEYEKIQQNIKKLQIDSKTQNYVFL